jgi:hypothetical protein
VTSPEHGWPELGCGTGEHTAYAAAHGARLAIGVATQRLAEARARYGHLPSGLASRRRRPCNPFNQHAPGHPLERVPGLGAGEAVGHRLKQATELGLVAFVVYRGPSGRLILMLRHTTS